MNYQQPQPPFNFNIQSQQPNQYQQPTTQIANPFATLLNPNSPFQFNLSQPILQQEPTLIDKIKNLKIPNVYILGEKDIVRECGGEDAIGIDVCCGNDQKLIAIKQSTNIGSTLKELTQFLYTCNILEKKYCKQLIKVFVTNLPCDVSSQTAVTRNGIMHHSNANAKGLTDDTANFVKSQF